MNKSAARRSRWLTAFLCCCAALNYADRTALSSVVPPLRESIGISDTQIGITGMLFLWSYAIASLFAGNFADRFSRVKIVMWSLASWSAVTLLTGMVSNVTQLFAARTILGVAESFYLPAAVALLAAHHSPATRGRAMGLHLLGLNFGLIGGGVAAGVMAEHFGWRPGFWVLGGTGLLLAALAPRFLQDQPPESAEAQPLQQPPPRSAGREAWAYCLRVPSFCCLLANAMSAGVASWVFLTWLPLFFTENYGLNLGAAGLTGVALYKSPMFLGLAIGGWLSDKAVRHDPRGRALLNGLASIACAPFLAFFIGTPSFAFIVAALAASTLIRAIGTPSEHSLLCEVIPPAYRSTAVGILNTCGTAAGGLGVLLAGFFKKEFGLSSIFGASSFIYVCAGLIMLLAYRMFVRRDIERAARFETTSPSLPSVQQELAPQKKGDAS